MSDQDFNSDGITHIRLSPDAATMLGRKLYIGAYQPFTDPVYGWFASIIGFWVWYCQTHGEDDGSYDSLRGIHHDNMIRSSLSGLTDSATHRSKVCEVLCRRIENDLTLQMDLRNSTLPFEAYETIYYSATGEYRVYPLTDRQWYVHTLENLRKELQSD